MVRGVRYLPVFGCLGVPVAVYVGLLEEHKVAVSVHIRIDEILLCDSRFVDVLLPYPQTIRCGDDCAIHGEACWSGGVPHVICECPLGSGDLTAGGAARPWGLGAPRPCREWFERGQFSWVDGPGLQRGERADLWVRQG